MADGYTILGTVPSIEVVGAGTTRDVQIVTAQAVPSGVSFSTVVAKADFAPTPLNLILGTIAEALNKAADVPGVVDVTVYQDVNNAGQFVNKASVTVESTSGNSSDTISVPYGAIFDKRLAADVKRERENLDAIEAL